MSSLETWPQELTDFALVSKDGEVLNCHKARLADSSEYFQAMFGHEFCETTSNKMDVPEYGGMTVASFLEWISIASNAKAPPSTFDVEKFSTDLLRMAHLYQVKDLITNCEGYLQKNISKENAVEAWKAGLELGCQELDHQALKFIARSYLKGEASEITGFEDNASCLVMKVMKYY